MNADGMKVLVVGGGGREHALCWKIAQSRLVSKVFCAPGNAGIAAVAECVAIDDTDLERLVDFAAREAVGLTVIGPEAPLAAGLADLLAQRGLDVFGPCKAAARLEGSKSFAKHIMEANGVPTAQAKSFDSLSSALAYIMECPLPVVVKADGLAAGKGVVVAKERAVAVAALNQIMNLKIFGEAGESVLVEECLEGEEASFLTFTDGETILPLPASQDHKRVYDGDRGPNTGGMGAYSPAPVITPALERQIIDEIMRPTINGLAKEGIPYRGVLYAGLMISQGRPKVLEFNCRFGDPETQPLLMRLESDLVEIMLACARGGLASVRSRWSHKSAVCVVMASGGYPGPYQKGQRISGLADAGQVPETVVFHAGTVGKNGLVVTNGGRVLGVTSLGEGIGEAMDRTYEAASHIEFAGAHFRKDIGARALRREGHGPRVGIVMGSGSDLPVMQQAAKALADLGVACIMTISSAHRSPDRTLNTIRGWEQAGVKVIIAGAGAAAHLAGTIAAHTTLPVIGVPLDSSPLKGIDALLATAQMPSGVPVATMALGSAGATNAGVLAAQILALEDPALTDRLREHRRALAEKVERQAADLLPSDD
ncbi:MAG: phosphoribosylamine--glycine ligase [Pseudomonadota bacterium]